LNAILKFAIIATPNSFTSSVIAAQSNSLPLSINSTSHRSDDFFSAIDQQSISSEREDNIRYEAIPYNTEICVNFADNSVAKEHPVKIVTISTSYQEEHYLTETTNLPNTSVTNVVLQSENILKEAIFKQESMCDGKVLTQREIRRYEMADNVYEKAKSAWSFGKGVSVFKPFMGLAEGVAAKALSVTVGVDDFEEADIMIRERLGTLDKDLVDPAINKVWEVISPYFEKRDDILQAFIGMTKKKIPFACEEMEVENTIPLSDAVEDADIDTKPPSTAATPSDKITPTPIAPTH